MACFISKYEPNSGHQLQWHNDVPDERLAAFNLCLNFWGESDGALEIKNTNTGEEILNYKGDTPGTLVIFKIDSHLIHRVTEPTNFPRVSMTGWLMPN
jgi:Rps23 Pro-64 3,4-dihydroxylase Tpa1-like proline 4-hydroxylase